MKMVKVYNKVIRDKIPEIIRESGRQSKIKVLPDDEFLPELENKLSEEIAEYLASRSIEELVDIIEVVFRISQLRGKSLHDIEQIRSKKREKRGGFEQNLFLIQVE